MWCRAAHASDGKLAPEVLEKLTERAHGAGETIETSLTNIVTQWEGREELMFHALEQQWGKETDKTEL